MKNTSIEWLFNLTNEGYWDSLDDASKQKALKLAMDMHKEEIERAYTSGVISEMKNPLDAMHYKIDSEQYYNKTYGGNK